MGFYDDPTFAPPGAGLPQPAAQNLPTAFEIPLPGEQTAGGAPDWLRARPPAGDPAMFPGPLPASFGAGSGGAADWGGVLPGEQPTGLIGRDAAPAPSYLMRQTPITATPPPGGWPLFSDLPRASPTPVRPTAQGSNSSGGTGGPAKPAGPSPIEQAYIDQGKALDDATKAQVGQSNAQAQHDSDQAQAEANAVARAQEHRQAVGDEFMKRMSGIEKLNDDLAQQHPDPNRLWNSLGNGEKLMGGLAMALHGIGDAFLGTNTQDPISRAIDRDIQLQREALENKRQGLANKTNFVKMYRDAGLNDAEAAAHAKLQIIQLLDKRVDDTLQGAKNQAMIANGATVKAKLQEEKLKAMDDAKMRTLTQAGMAAETRLKNAQAAAAAMKPLPGGASDPLTRQVGNRLVRFKDEKEARNFDETVTAAAVHSDALDKLEELSKKPGIGPWLGRMLHMGSDFQTANAARDDITAMSNAAKGISTQMSQPVTERLNHALTPSLLSDNAGPIGIEREGSIKGIAQTLISQGVSPQDAVEAAHAAIAAQKVAFAKKGH